MPYVRIDEHTNPLLATAVTSTRKMMSNGRTGVIGGI